VAQILCGAPEKSPIESRLSGIFILIENQANDFSSYKKLLPGDFIII